MKLEWHDEGLVVWALSCCHDDGANFSYEFGDMPDGKWNNQSDAELLGVDAPLAFDTLDAAKAWAEKEEKEWRVTASAA